MHIILVHLCNTCWLIKSHSKCIWTQIIISTDACDHFLLIIERSLTVSCILFTGNPRCRGAQEQGASGQSLRLKTVFYTRAMDASPVMLLQSFPVIWNLPVYTHSALSRTETTCCSAPSNIQSSFSFSAYQSYSGARQHLLWVNPHRTEEIKFNCEPNKACVALCFTWDYVDAEL